MQQNKIKDMVFCIYTLKNLMDKEELNYLLQEIFMINNKMDKFNSLMSNGNFNLTNYNGLETNDDKKKKKTITKKVKDDSLKIWK